MPTLCFGKNEAGQNLARGIVSFSTGVARACGAVVVKIGENMGQYSVETRGSDKIFQLSGELGLEETAALRPLLWSVMEEPEVTRVIIDLTGAKRVDASVISLFVATKNGLGKRRRRLLLCGMKREIFQLFEQTNLNAYFDIRKEPPGEVVVRD